MSKKDRYILLFSTVLLAGATVMMHPGTVKFWASLFDPDIYSDHGRRVLFQRGFQYVIFAVLAFNSWHFFIRGEFLRLGGAIAGGGGAETAEECKSACPPSLPFTVIGTALIFAVIFHFFFRVHPLIPFDSDAWSQYSQYITTWPQIDEWNPARSLGGMLSGIAGLIGAYAFYPLHGDYVVSLLMSTAFLAASFCAVLFVFLYKTLFSFCKNNIITLMAAIFFFINIFAIFKSAESNKYLLYAHSLGIFLYYVVPNIFISILILYFLRLNIENKFPCIADIGIFQYGFLIILLYYAVFSVLFSTVLLITYCFCILCFQYIDADCRERRRPSLVFNRRNAIWLLILLFFFLYMIFEFCGDRANFHLPTADVFSRKFLSGLAQSAKNIASFFPRMNNVFLFFVATILFLAAGVKFSLRQRGTRSNLFLPFFFLFAPCLLFLIYAAAAAKAGPYYAGSIEHVYGIFFVLLLGITLALVYTIQNVKSLFFILPMMIVILFFESIFYQRSFAEGNRKDFTNDEQLCIMQSWLSAIRNADLRGDEAVEIIVPRYAVNNNNWPFLTTEGSSFGIRFSKTLFLHNITSKKMTITMLLEEHDRVLQFLGCSGKSREANECAP
jgi:hypothetical protein